MDMNLRKLCRIYLGMTIVRGLQSSKVVVKGYAPYLSDVIDTGSVQFGASLSTISPCVLLLFTFYLSNKTHESILENASTNCTAARGFT